MSWLLFDYYSCMLITISVDYETITFRIIETNCRTLPERYGAAGIHATTSIP